MEICIDIETLRAPKTYLDDLIKESKTNFKAPSTLSKSQAAQDLGLTDDKEIKFTSKDDMIARWVSELADKKAEPMAVEQWKKTSFNPELSPIACISIKTQFTTADFYTSEFVNEGEMLEQFHDAINSMTHANGAQISKPYFIGHNIGKFDLPFIYKRSVINNVKPCSGVKWIDGRHGQHHFCTMLAWAGFGNRISADNLCKLLGITGKGDMDGSKVYDEWQKNPQKVIEYCADDVRMVSELHKRLTS